MSKIFKNKKTGLVAVIILAVLAIACIFGLSYALTTYESDTTNTITTGSVNGRIVEDYEEPSGVLPGASVKKVVNVENTGNLPALVRIKVDKVCGYSRDNNGNIDTDTVVKEGYKDSEKIKNGDKISISFDNTSWIDGGDGYYYYTDVLGVGETTKAPLFRNYTIDKNAGNEYRNAVCDILVNADIIQTMKNSDLQDQWGKSYSQLEMAAPTDENSKLGDTSVAYISPKEKFDIDASKIDLFKNFKNLSPGVSRTQTINISNNYSHKQEFYLRAELAEQDENNREKIEKLIKEYVIITVKNGADVIYHGPVWGNLDSESSGGPETMKSNISLGSFASSETKNLTVSLSASNEMTNEYSNLAGNVKWVFGTYDTESALVNVKHYMEGTTTPIYPGAEEHFAGEIGEDFSTNPLDLDSLDLVDFEYVSSSCGRETCGGTFTENEQEFIYYYRLRNPVFNVQPVIEKTTTTPVLEDLDGYVEYDITYNAVVSHYKGDLTVTVVDQLPLPLSDESKEFYSDKYNEENNTLTWEIKKDDVDTFTNGPEEIRFTQHVKVKYSGVKNATSINNIVKGTMSFSEDYDPIEVEDDANTITNVSGKVTAQYLFYGTDTKLLEDVITTGSLGDDYTTKVKDIEGYTFVESTDNTEGKYEKDPIVVKYFYRKANTEVSDDITKAGLTKALNVSDLFDYTVHYKGTIKNYVGPATLTIVDQLPFAIDESESNLDNGKYDSNKKTITWTIPIDKVDATSKDYILEKKFKLSLHFSEVPNVTSFTNKVSYTLETDKKTTGSDKVTTQLYKKKTKLVINHYLDNTNKKLAPTEVVWGNTGEKYTTSVSQKVLLKGYKLTYVDGLEEGTLYDGTTYVNYYYKKTSTGIRNPYTGDDITIYLIIAATTLVVVISSIVYLKTSKRDIH